MPVRDLVQQFESSSMSSASPSPVSPGGQPPPSPARFIYHPLLQRRSLPPPDTPPTPITRRAVDHAREAAEEHSGIPRSPSATSVIRSPRYDSTDGHDDSGLAKSMQVVPRMAAGAAANTTDPPKVSHQLVGSPSGNPSSDSRRDEDLTSGFSDGLGQNGHSRQGEELVQPSSTSPRGNHMSARRIDSNAAPLLKASVLTVGKQRSRTSNDIPLKTLSRDTHVNYDHNDLTSSRPLSSSSTLVPHPISTPHVPIAAKTVFSRGSAPLLLPPLDDYLSSLPPPMFSSFPSRTAASGGKSPESAMFPPLDRLAATGRTIDDLEKNNVIAYPWRRRGNIFGALVGGALGLMGSSAIAGYYSLQGLYDGLQLFALLLSTIIPHAGKDLSDQWRKLFLGTIPNVLALNFSASLIDSFILLMVFMALAGLLLYYFHVLTTRIALESSREGFQAKDTDAGWGIVFTTFTLTFIYLPLSTIAVHGLLWSQDFWAVPNPYINATTFPPDLPPLGPPSEFRDPLDFCYTTTMSKNEINFAPVVVIFSVLTFIFLTVWFPVRLASVIRLAVPRVDRYTELGKRRSRVELNHEYERLLSRDKHSFNFLYKDFQRQWGAYKSFFLFVKLTTLLTVAFLDPNNCVFRNANAKTVSIVRGAILVFAMVSFFVIQIFLTPFLDPIDNASEWCSRVGYATFAILGFAVALDPPNTIKNALNGPILYIVYAINYGLTFYFLLINTSFSHRLVKRLFSRIDFSIDIFSPRLDISNTSRHTRRRIWQETISALLLTTPDCAIPKSQQMVFSESQEYQWPPYLLGFQGRPAERHVENLKILRELGGLAYAKGLAMRAGQCSERLNCVQEQIQRHFIGPDSYWMPCESRNKPGGFGNAWWIPFPPTLVIRFDSGRLAVLDRLQEFEDYVHQNEGPEIQEKRNIRMALRALDGLVVTWPYTHTKLLGSRVSWCCGSRYTAQTTVDYNYCVLSITRRGSLPWRGFELGSGFDVRLTYARGVQVDCDIIGLDNDFDLTPQLANFLVLNKEIITYRLPRIEAGLRDYRRQARRDMETKLNVLTYEFLSTVYDFPKDPHLMAKIIMEQEKDIRTRQAFVEHQDALVAANERMTMVNRTKATTWWYLYWDDFWRRNHETINALNTHAPDFDPHYPTSIAYRPLPRAALEIFLTQRGLLDKNGSWLYFIHSGVLNKLYFRLNQIIFHGSDKDIPVHLGDASFEVDIEDLEFSSHPKSSSLGTGGGTDHDDESIRARPFYKWEAIYDDPLQHGAGGRRNGWLPKISVWFGLSRFWRSGKFLTNGVSLDVSLEDGKYVLLEHAVNELKDKVD